MSAPNGSRLKPPRLESGMAIGIIAPSSPLRIETFERGLENIQQAGFRTVLGDNIRASHGYLAGSDNDRANDLTEMFARKDIDAVFCACGGYGASRMADRVDWDVVAANPKIFVGYSDVTSLHLAFEHRTNQTTIYGPMVGTFGAGLSDLAQQTFWRLICSPEPHGTLDTGDAEIRTVAGGKAKGRLAGGCLAILNAGIGTIDEPDFDGRIVLIEDIGDPLYRSDRFLVQLRRVGILEKAAGFVIGRLTDWEKEEKAPPVITPDDLWRDIIAPLGKPAISGFPFGHVKNPLTLPLGCLAELDADTGTLTILAAAVR